MATYENLYQRASKCRCGNTTGLGSTRSSKRRLKTIGDMDQCCSQWGSFSKNLRFLCSSQTFYFAADLLLLVPYLSSA